MPGGQYIKPSNSSKSTFMIFSPYAEEVGALARSLKIFESHKINLLYIESRPSKRFPGKYQFVVECDTDDAKNLQAAIDEIKKNSEYFNIISRNHTDNKGNDETN